MSAEPFLPAGLPDPVLEPVTLSGRHVRLEPLTPEHGDALWAAHGAPGPDGGLTRLFPNPIDSRAGIDSWIESALAGRGRGKQMPFVQIALPEGVVCGSTRFGNAALDNRRIEIGWTWIGRRWQRSPLNTEAKYLLLRHAFETMGLIRVELKTDRLNVQSRAAIARIGAVEEATLRHHIVCDDGRIRDSVMFAVIRPDWPSVKARLETMLAR